MEQGDNQGLRNVFFFSYINSIGGVETFFYELCKKYSKDYDIVVYYGRGDMQQIKRLQKFVRVVKYNNEEIYCEHAFFNYGLEPFISHVHADHVYELIHADFALQKNITPHVDRRVNTYLAVSQRVADSFYAMTGIKCEVCPNPLTVEEVKAPLFLCAAQRMTSEKGGLRIAELVRRLDADEEIKYYLLIFTNENTPVVRSRNVAMMPQRLDIRPFIYGCDIFLALSDSEGRCYSVGEKLAYGTGKLLITPCPSFFEQGCNLKNSIVLEFDMSNMDEVIEKIRKVYRKNRIKEAFAPVKCEDVWDKYLVKGKSDYVYKLHKVRANSKYTERGIFDTQLNCIPKAGTEFEVDTARLEKLLSYGLVEVIEPQEGL